MPRFLRFALPLVLALAMACAPGAKRGSPAAPADDDLASSGPDAATGGFDPDWRFLRDADGGALVLHGCNFDGAAKGASGLPVLTRDQALALGSAWGFDFARYLIFWARIEPTRGTYDEAYLDEVEARLDWLADAGMKVVLDMHQDMWGPFITPAWSQGSDGAPEWATVTDGRPYLPIAGWLGVWAADYLAPAVMRAFDNFWDHDGHPDLQDRYAAMWAHVVERFKGHPAVLGYDIMNEPWQGSGLLRLREFDETTFTEFTQRLIDAIRQADPDGWIFYEPCALAANQGMPSHLGLLADPRPGPSRLAFFPHFYPIRLDLDGVYDPATDHSIENWEANRTMESRRHRAPLLSGEWGMLRWNDPANRIAFLDDALRMFERAASGWSYWECTGVVRDGDPEFQRTLAHPYPRRVAGTPVSYGFDEATRTLTVVYDDRAGTTGATEIYVPARDYPDGWTLQASDPEGTWRSQWDDAASVLRVWIDPGPARHTIRVVPAASSCPTRP